MAIRCSCKRGGEHMPKDRWTLAGRTVRPWCKEMITATLGFKNRPNNGGGGRHG